MAAHKCTIKNEGVKPTGSWRVDCSCGWYRVGLKNEKRAQQFAAAHEAGANDGEPVRSL